MFKIEKCILSYGCFKYPWEQLYYYFRAAIFRKTFSSRTPPVSASEDCLNIDYYWEFFNKIFIGKISSPQNRGEGREGGLAPPPPPFPMTLYFKYNNMDNQFHFKKHNQKRHHVEYYDENLKQFLSNYSTWWSFWL